MLTSFHKMRGMSLVELMLAVVIMAFLMVLGAGSFSTWTQNQQIRKAAESMLNGMQVARSEAVKRNANAVFVMCGPVMGTSDSSWDVLAASPTASSVACTPTDNPGATGWERIQQLKAQEAPQNVVANATAAATNAVVFNSMGRIAPAGAALPPSAGAVPTPGITQVDISNPSRTDSRPLRVTVNNPGGSVRMCDPSPLLAATDARHC